MPLYSSHPLPGMPGGEPVRPHLTWGPGFGTTRDDFLDHGSTPRPRRTGVTAALLVLCIVAAALIVLVLAL
jgi:hypothetical protein